MKKNILSLLFNSVIVGFTVTAVILMLRGDTSFAWFNYFTVDSNILMGLVSLVMVIFNILSLIKKKLIRNKVLSCLKIMGTSGVTLTFVTVFVFLLPTQGNFAMMLLGTNLFMHVLTPVAAFITFVFFDENVSLTKKECLFSILPSFIYSFIYLACILTNTWKDFYGFTFGGRYYLVPLVMLVIWGISYLFALLLRFLSKKTERK